MGIYKFDFVILLYVISHKYIFTSYIRFIKKMHDIIKHVSNRESYTFVHIHYHKISRTIFKDLI